MNLLVTGGAGFIGSNFVHYWMKNYPEDKVVVYDLLTYAGNKENLKDFEGNSNYDFVHGDIKDKPLVIKTIEDHNIDTIVHFAAETHVDRSIEGPAVFIETNVMGTYVLLEVAREKNLRFHHISTDEVFGSLELDSTEKFTEKTPYDPRSPYSASKAGSDHLVRAYIETYGLQATISNCSNNYGPYMFPEKLIPLVITRALNDEQVPVYGDGLNVRDWIYAEDHCRGVDLILKKGRIGETYLFGGNGEDHNINIVKKLLDILGKPHDLIVFVGDRKGHDRRYAVDFSKAKNELGYEPLKPIDEWLKETVEWYKQNEEWWKPLKADADKIAEKYLANPLK